MTAETLFKEILGFIPLINLSILIDKFSHRAGS